METFSEKDNHRKVLALIVCLFLGFIYIETVWKPYFYGTGQTRPLESSGEKTDSSSSVQRSLAQGEQSLSSGQDTALARTPGVPAEASAEQGALSGYPTDKQIENVGFAAIATNNITLKVSLLGGRITELLLNNFLADLNDSETKLNLVFHGEASPYPLGVYSGQVDDSRVSYQIASSDGLRKGAGGEYFGLSPSASSGDLVLRGSLPDGREITKKLRFYPNGYFVDVSIALSAAAPDSSRIALEWTRLFGQDEASLLDPYNVIGFVWFDGQKAFRESFGDFEDERREAGDIRWITLTDKYFMATLLSRAELAPGLLKKTGQLFRSRLLGGDTKAEFTVFCGPKSYGLLTNLGFELQRNIDFGKTGFIAAPLLSLLHKIYSFMGNWGLAIVALTILVRLLLYPLNATSFRQMKAMQDLKPEMDRIREQVSDKQQQQMELMALYKKRGVNPLGGCLPVALQMPIFIGLYSALMLAVDLRHAPFALWITDLSAPEKFMMFGIPVPVMVILFVVSMLVQQWTTPSTMDPTQKKVMLIMPIVFGFMFAKFPAGLTLYWLTNNLISIGQQKAMHRHHGNGRSALAITVTVSLIVFLLAFVVSRF